MKKNKLLILILMLSCIVVLALAGCREKLKGEEDLIAKAREEITVAEADTNRWSEDRISLSTTGETAIPFW